ncbi:MAG: hypothetical protein ACXWAX_09650 [Chthoniobacterales bacterium]
MNRAVVVLLLLIANAIVSSRNSNPPDPSPVSVNYSLGLFTVVDGAPIRNAAEEHTGVCPLQREHNAAAPVAFDDIRL